MKAGIDDFGTGNLKGYSCIVLRSPGAEVLEHKGREILFDSNLTEFHGSKFKVNHSAMYKSFFETLKETFTSYGECASFQLLHVSHFKEILSEFGQRLANGALSNVMNAVPAFVAKKTGPMIAFSRELSNIQNRKTDSVAVSIDWDNPHDVADAEEPVEMSGNIGTITTTAADALVRLVNVYKNRLFPNTPRIDSVKVCDSADSILVQAADVIANFGVNYAKSKIHEVMDIESSMTEKTKAHIFSGIVTDSTTRLTGLDLSVQNHNLILNNPTETLRLQLFTDSP